MQFSIDNLASETGLPSSTIRFYQSKGLLSPPRRVGRRAVYGADHLKRLELIERLKKRGFSLAGIRQLLDGHGAGASLQSVLGLTGSPSAADPQRDINDLVASLFPGGIESEAIRNAVELGVLAVQGDRVTLVNEGLRPLVEGILQLFALGLPESTAMELWAAAMDRVGAIASEFHQVAETHVYPSRNPDEAQVALRQLVEVAVGIVSFALATALRNALVGEEGSALRSNETGTSGP